MTKVGEITIDLTGGRMMAATLPAGRRIRVGERLGAVRSTDTAREYWVRVDGRMHCFRVSNDDLDRAATAMLHAHLRCGWED